MQNVGVHDDGLSKVELIHLQVFDLSVDLGRDVGSLIFLMLAQLGVLKMMKAPQLHDSCHVPAAVLGPWRSCLSSWRSWRARKNSRFFSRHFPRRRFSAFWDLMRRFLIGRMDAMARSGE